MSEQAILVDARRLLCPLPVIRLQQAVKEHGRGNIFKVVATDPGVKSDIPAWCRVHKCTVLNVAEHGKEIEITVSTA